MKRRRSAPAKQGAYPRARRYSGRGERAIWKRHRVARIPRFRIAEKDGRRGMPKIKRRRPLAKRWQPARRRQQLCCPRAQIHLLATPNFPKLRDRLRRSVAHDFGTPGFTFGLNRGPCFWPKSRSLFSAKIVVPVLAQIAVPVFGLNRGPCFRPESWSLFLAQIVVPVLA